MIKTLFLNALPAGGKSEIRTYLSCLGPEVCKRDFLIGDIVQLDDYPYVHIMRRIDEELALLGHRGMFFELPDRGFISSREWGTLIKLVAMEYEDMRCHANPNRPHNFCDWFDEGYTTCWEAGRSASSWMFHRIDRAREMVGICQFINELPLGTLNALWKALEAECKDFVNEKQKNAPDSLEGKTVVIEFSRGGPHSAKFPLTGGNGYEYSYAQFSDETLKDAAVLYVHVTPEISRARNEARGREEGAQDKPAAVQLMTSLLHRVPDHVMWNAYGCDDIQHLMATSGIQNAVRIKSANTVERYTLPVAFFRNAGADLTTFTHKKPEEWKPEDKAAIRTELTWAFAGLAAQYKRIHDGV
jgi:hypothetical protein